MTPTTIRIVSFGSAKALTQQDIQGVYLEATFQKSREPM